VNEDGFFGTAERVKLGWPTLHQKGSGYAKVMVLFIALS